VLPSCWGVHTAQVVRLTGYWTDTARVWWLLSGCGKVVSLCALFITTKVYAVPPLAPEWGVHCPLRVACLSRTLPHIRLWLP
jgi:hypothetical protein